MMASSDKGEEVLKVTGWHHADLAKPTTPRYAITGHESQCLTIALGPGDTAQGEPGSMMFLTKDMTQSASFEGCWARCCSGESCCAVNFTNSGSNQGFVALTPNFPTAKVIPVNLASENVSNSLIAQQGAFMASHGDVEIGMDCDCNLTRCCCGGMGLVRQKINGGGTVSRVESNRVQSAENILLDTSHFKNVLKCLEHSNCRYS